MLTSLLVNFISSSEGECGLAMRLRKMTDHNQKLPKCRKLSKWGKVLPERYYTVAGVKLHATDMLRVGEMLEAERLLGTEEAARLFQPTFDPGKYTWGPDGHGNIYLPLRGGGRVDIDWLNTLVASQDKFSFRGIGVRGSYHLGKIGWAVARGLIKGSLKFLWKGLKSFNSEEERKAVTLAERILGYIPFDVERLSLPKFPLKYQKPSFRNFLHPDLVHEAEQVLAESRWSVKGLDYKVDNILNSLVTICSISPRQKAALLIDSDHDGIPDFLEPHVSAFQKGSLDYSAIGQIAQQHLENSHKRALESLRILNMNVNDLDNDDIDDLLENHSSPYGGKDGDPFTPW